MTRSFPRQTLAAAVAAVALAGATLPALAGEGSCCDSATSATQFIAADAPTTKPAEPAKSADEMLAEIKAIQPPAFDSGKRADEEYVQKYLAERQEAMEKQAALAERFADAYPKNDLSPRMLMMAAQVSQDEGHAMKLYRRVAADYPDSPMAKSASAQVRRADGVGKAFEIKFTDAVSGDTVSSETLKGKIVVVDFWATWCGPCVAELPTMKKIYADYHDKGVEFVGISLDAPPAEGGKDKLLAFVKSNEMSWPQYYQGNGWKSDFSSSWGVNSIPALFVVGADGKLVSTEARGELEEMLPKLIAQRDAADAKPAAGETSGGM